MLINNLLEQTTGLLPLISIREEEERKIQTITWTVIVPILVTSSYRRNLTKSIFQVLCNPDKSN